MLDVETVFALIDVVSKTIAVVVSNWVVVVVGVVLVIAVDMTVMKAGSIDIVTVAVPVVRTEVVERVCLSVIKAIFDDVDVEIVVVLTVLTGSFVVTTERVDVVYAVANLICVAIEVVVNVDVVGLGTRCEHLEVK